MTVNAIIIATTLISLGFGLASIFILNRSARRDAERRKFKSKTGKTA